MQITMAYANEISLGFPPSLKSTAGGPPRIDVAKQQFRKQQRPHPKSQPFDPEDLRRRLYVVIAEREAQNEKRQRQRVDALPAKWAQERDTQHLYIDRLATTNAAWAGQDTTAPVRRSVSISKSKTQSPLQDKLRRSSSERSSTAAETNECPKYRHIPEQAAAQFSRTTTSGSMQSDKSVVHSLSRAALRFYAEGASSADRSAIESSITPGKQRKILQRARSQQDRQHTRNQFQDHKVAGEEAAPWRRSSKSGPGAGEKTILEEVDGVSALADLHLHAYTHHSESSDNNKELHSSEETLVDTATANEHRIDWSQSDEMLPHERRGVKLLRKTTSILTLKGKLGHLRKDSKENNKLRIVTIQEDCDEQAEADADDGSTPMSPNSGTSGRSPRLGIWGRLKRN
ncbi:hypothetical protein EKO27_g8220 [Xylaria grammica]|uniref:Uncharacterized protein n=1 Tax=Xylaria grammica TaxID=363999 RepID=A0A439CXD7_9PEZI|nr:hypothetical protein EKO27_g8220 [Xylaria grammica]